MPPPVQGRAEPAQLRDGRRRRPTPNPSAAPALRTTRYAIGWSDTKGTGASAVARRSPTSRSQIYHFLKVTVSGSSVTVTPTDSTGRTFDVKTYTFKPLPDTFIDSAPPAGTTSNSATFQFHASGTPATFTCKLDSAAAKACTSPITYTNLAQGPHTFSVVATINRVADPQGATATWTVDSTAPTTPGGFTATATSPFSVSLHWNAATDNTGVTGYDIVRDGTTLATVAPARATSTPRSSAPTTHQYAVRARDIAGNLSLADADDRGHHAGAAAAGLRRRIRVGKPVVVDQLRRTHS